ncbi:MAG: DUF4974 domain-containing protein [Maribacter sp.]
MNREQIKILFAKYINNDCSEEELVLLEKFLESYQNKSSQDFPEVRLAQQDAKKRMWEKIKNDIERKKHKNRYSSLLKYAAAIVMLLSTSLYFYLNNSVSTIPAQALQIEENAVILKSGKEQEQKLNILGKQVITNDKEETVATQSGSRLIYQRNENRKELVYHEIDVPHGKKFQIQLSDGTLVHLNAGTSMRFPENFVEGKNREVFLKGEAYFEVAKDTENPFIVHSKDLQINVLGTHFVVNSHTEGSRYAVLLEGSISARTGNDGLNGKVILPGEKVSQKGADLNVEKIDIEDYTAWLNGRLSFNNQPFSEIIKKIERKYNVVIKNEYEALSTVKFRGKFDDETIIDLLDVFKESAAFEYKIIANEIVITRPKVN